MSFFGRILEKLGMGSARAAPASSTPSTAAPRTAAAPTGAPGTAAPRTAAPPTAAPATPGATGAATAPATPQAVPVVDVVAQLEKRAAANPQKLNWRTSIVDLLKLLDIDSSLQARKELATELGCPPDLMNDSAKMNMWLHRTVLARIAANGGNVPKELLD